MTLLGLCLASLAAGAAEHPAGELVLIGSVGGADGGIYSARLDDRTGRLSSATQLIQLNRVQWLIQHPRLPVIYTLVTASGGRTATSLAYSLTVDPAGGTVKELNHVEAGGLEATHLDIDLPSQTLFSANHDSGSISALPLHRDGSIGAVASVQTDTGKGPVPRRQDQPVAHCVAVDPTHKYVLLADLGADQVFIYRLDPSAHSLSLAGSETVTPGSGPRHMVFDPQGKRLYLVSELNSQLDVFNWDAKEGRLHALQTLQVDANDPTTSAAAEITVSRDGRFVYVSLRGNQNSIVAYAIDRHSGALKEIQRVSSGGKSPRSFGIDPTGRWLLVTNDGSGTVTVLKIDQASGLLTATGQSIAVPKAAAVLFVRK
jgi:6-phosphogluconolactonase